jgi:ATP-binding cassette subfamily C protein LapB
MSNCFIEKFVGRRVVSAATAHMSAGLMPPAYIPTKIATTKKGLQQEIFEGGSGLSGGQRQLVNLTRAFLRRPTLWLLDEPTASMDRGLELQVTQALKAAIRPTDTLVLVTHKGEMLELVERVIVIANQQVVLDGPKAQVLQKLQTPPGAAPNTRAA